MVKLIVIAGSSSQKLAEFFSKRGTFEIVAMYENFADNVNQIQNHVTISDKLLYLYNDVDDSSMNIKSDMQVLSNLLNNDSFFKPGEIVFMTTTSQQAQLAVKFFVTVMGDCNKTDYSIKTVQEKLSFALVYDLLMGTTSSTDFDNTYRTLYKVERDTDANFEYQPEDDRKMLVEPFDNNSVILYSEKQKAAKKADTGTVYTDNPDTQFTQDNSIQFDALKLKSIDEDVKYVLVTGLQKSGKSIWATQLALSAYKCGLSICLMDFTRNADIFGYLERSSINVTEESMIQVLRKQTKDHDIVYTTPSNDNESGVCLEFFQLFTSQKLITFDVVFVVCEINTMNAYYEMTLGKVDVLTTVNATMGDINITNSYIPMFDNRARCTMILNNVVALNDDFVDAQELRNMMPETLRIVKHKQFLNFDAKEQLYKAVIGV